MQTLPHDCGVLVVVVPVYLKSDEHRYPEAHNDIEKGEADDFKARMRKVIAFKKRKFIIFSPDLISRSAF